MRVQAALPPATPPRNAPMSAGEANAIHGCGWFDSSYELSQGLEVTEGGADEDGLLAALCIATLSFMSRSAATFGEAGKPTCH